MNARYLTAVLNSENIQYDLVTDGEKALQAGSTDRYDLLVLDVNMPKLNGVQVAEAITTSNGPNCETPIIALTANVFPDDIEKYRAAGMGSHIGKPYTPQALLKGFRKALSDGDKTRNLRVVEIPAVGSKRHQERERRSS